MTDGEKTQPCRPICVAVIGNFRRKDFCTVIEDIGAITPAVYFDSLSLFLKNSGSGQNYDLIFLLSSSFGQYASPDIRALQNRWPLARIIMIAGSLAEGERRTGQLPAELLRYYWHQWRAEVLPALTAFCEHRPSPWTLPLGSTDENRILKTVALAEERAFNRPHASAGTKQQSLIVASDSTMREMLMDLAKQKGFAATAVHPSEIESYQGESLQQPAEICFDDISENFAETLAIVYRLKTRWPHPARLIVLYNAPRPHEMEQLLHAGVGHVVSKPFLMSW